MSIMERKRRRQGEGEGEVKWLRLWKMRDEEDERTRV